MPEQYALAATYNNAGAMDYIYEILVSGRPLFSSVSGLGKFIPGLEFIPLGGVVLDNGFKSWKWRSPAMSPAELDYLMLTYLAGERSGQVTARTKNNRGVWANYNAVLTFPNEFTLDGRYYVDVIWAFTRGVAL
jgi:hypothetical protein